MKTLLVVNPAAGHGRGKKYFHQVYPHLREKIPGLEVRITEFAGHGIEIGKRAADEDFDRLICLGGDGTPGRFRQRLRVYGRAGEPCVSCGTRIERLRLAGRSTHFCPKCQVPGERPGP